MAMLTLCRPTDQTQEWTTPSGPTPEPTTSAGVSYSSIIIRNAMSFGTLRAFLLLFYFIAAALFFASFLFRVFSTFFTCRSPFNG